MIRKLAWLLIVATFGVACANQATPIEAAADAGRSGWSVTCGYRHSDMFDPIVSPGGLSSHLHDFMGQDITPDSTYESLRASGSSCNFTSGGSGDRSGYWTPTLYEPGEPRTQVEPAKMIAYYRSAIGVNYRAVEPFPVGLQYIAGRHDATDAQLDNEGERVVLYSCGGAGNGRLEDRDLPYNCNPGSKWPKVIANIRFPDCSDGRTTSEDHRSHMAYSQGGACPESHPVHVPELSLQMQYRTANGEGAYLSSSHEQRAYGMHADFFEAWNQERFRELMRQCINAGVSCGGDGRP